MESLLFYSFSALSVLSALSVVLVKKPTRALLSLVVTMVALSGLYLLLGAYFIAIAQIIVYAGAVLVLFLFVIMLQGVAAEDIPLLKRFPLRYIILFLAAGGVFIALLTVVFSRINFPALRVPEGTLEAVGRSLFTDFLLPFELTAVLLLLSVFAAVALAKKDDAL